ncbi:MAG: citrate lyase holo-[acyl-carrier protein] synthase [Firmicutes bacterium]|nr:citrate lyase holo-[acyl-carrier protein] synthase [Bacillota bacterium]
MKNDPLDARENRLNEINHLMTPDNTIILVKANIPGTNKNIREAHLLVRLFCLKIQNLYPLKKAEIKVSPDGPYCLFAVDTNNSLDIKKHMVMIEETHPLGRFIDLDVFHLNQFSLSRTDLHIPNRKCYLCNQDALFCSRNQTHPVDSLIGFIENQVRSYLRNIVTKIVHQAIITELNLDDKFGLVSKSSQGSHQDMDYLLMVKAEKAILPYLVDLFEVGFTSDHLSNLLEQTRPIGIAAEQEMLQMTQGVNAYKGLIFILGLALLATGYALSHQQDFYGIYSNVKIISETILDDFKKDQLTAGHKAYQTYKMTGIRGEAYRGISSVQSAMKLLTDDEDLTLRNVLKYLILVSEDTVFLKRAGNIENYNEIKEELKQTDVTQINQLKAFNKKMIQKHISFGGAADLLIVAIFLNLIRKEFY